ncbi:hypothetical protein HDV01_002808 [Terramyces sp. JEL0728]|nr:hypothetical protein HDV01_002808 [Terramyces sp. JEL0728]
MEYKVIPTFPNEMKSRYPKDRKYADEDDSYIVPPADLEFVAEDNTKIRKPVIKIPSTRNSTSDRRPENSPSNIIGSSPPVYYTSSPPASYGSPPISSTNNIYGSAPKEYQPIYGLSPNEQIQYHENRNGHHISNQGYHEQRNYDPVGMVLEPEYKFVKRNPNEYRNPGRSTEEMSSRSNTINSIHSQEHSRLQPQITGKPIFVSLVENTRPTELLFACILGFSIGENSGFDAGIHVLTYFEFITINWEKIEYLAQKHLDIDGDGKLTLYDAFFMVGKCFCHFALNVPTSVGFCSSVWFGYNW